MIFASSSKRYTVGSRRQSMRSLLSLHINDWMTIRLWLHKNSSCRSKSLLQENANCSCDFQLWMLLDLVTDDSVHLVQRCGERAHLQFLRVGDEHRLCLVPLTGHFTVLLRVDQQIKRTWTIALYRMLHLVQRCGEQKQHTFLFFGGDPPLNWGKCQILNVT